jgi:hypothetical protein
MKNNNVNRNMTNKEKFLSGQPFMWNKKLNAYHLEDGYGLVVNNKCYYTSVSEITEEGFSTYTSYFGSPIRTVVSFADCNFNLTKIELIAFGYIDRS